MRKEGRKVSSDESHGEPLGEDGGEAGAPKISLCCGLKRPCWLQTVQKCSLNKSHTSEPQFSALPNSNDTVSAFEVTKRIT